MKTVLLPCSCQVGVNMACCLPLNITDLVAYPDQVRSLAPAPCNVGSRGQVPAHAGAVAEGKESCGIFLLLLPARRQHAGCPCDAQRCRASGITVSSQAMVSAALEGDADAGL